MLVSSFWGGPRTLAKNERIAELDGIRAIAIWMVLLFHSIFAFYDSPATLKFLPGPVLHILSLGFLGVDLFFVLSGFLITGILFDAKDRPFYFRNFYARRIRRIMPLYFTVVAIWACLYRRFWQYFLLSSVFGANLAMPLHIPIPHGPGVLWSLAVEEHFYLLWPIAVLLLNRRAFLILSITIFLGCPAVRAVFAARGMDRVLVHDLSWFRFDGLAAGAILAMWARSRVCTKKISLVIAGFLLFAFAFIEFIGPRFGHTASSALNFSRTYLIFAAFFVLAFAYRGTPWTQFLRNRFMRFSATLSYCLYLIHLSIGDGCTYLIRHQNLITMSPTGLLWLRAAVMIGVSFVVAALSWKYFERPILMPLSGSPQNRESRQAAFA